jgi:hypothetical protein
MKKYSSKNARGLVSVRFAVECLELEHAFHLHTSAYVSIRQHTSAYVSRVHGARENRKLCQTLSLLALLVQ